MPERARGSRFAFEPAEARFVRVLATKDRLYRVAPARAEVACGEHLAHAATAERRLDLVGVAEDRARADDIGAAVDGDRWRVRRRVRSGNDDRAHRRSGGRRRRIVLDETELGRVDDEPGSELGRGAEAARDVVRRDAPAGLTGDGGELAELAEASALTDGVGDGEDARSRRDRAEEHAEEDPSASGIEAIAFRFVGHEEEGEPEKEPEQGNDGGDAPDDEQDCRPCGHATIGAFVAIEPHAHGHADYSRRPSCGRVSSVTTVGREKELDLLAASFDEGARLLTLVGPGGIGKSTLAGELGRRRVGSGARSRFVVVDLEGTSSTFELCDRVVEACGASAAGPRSAIDALGDALIVLDGFDLPDASATIETWLTGCPEIEIVVTSRQRLGIREERVYELGPLDPQTDGPRLLVLAARRAALGFAPRDEDAAAIGEIASILEGVPLALELAGARLPLVGPRMLAQELRTGIDLRRRDPTQPPRHISLDAAVRGSWQALGPVERATLAELTVFRGGFTLASARAIVGAPSSIEPLQARSLVRTRDASSARFDLYAQVREFVVAECPGPVAAAAERHSAWFGDEAERAAMRAHVDAEAREWLLAERENLLEVARRALTGGAPDATRAEAALRVLVAAKDVLLARGPAAELGALVSPIVDRTRDSGADPKLSARVMLLRGALRRERGDVRAALKDLLAGESVARALGDDPLGAEAALELGRTLRVAGEIDAARKSFERASRLAADAGLRVREAEATALLGSLAGEGNDLPTARLLCERALALAETDRLLGARLKVLVARAHAEAADRQAARASAERAAQRAEADGDPQVAGDALVLLGLVLHDLGQLSDAAPTLSRARDLLAKSGLEVKAAFARGHLGVLAHEQGRAAEAYAAIADARDVASRSNRPAHAAYFGAHLAAIEHAFGRHDAAAHILGRCSLERELDPWWAVSAIDVFGLAAALPAPPKAQGSGLLARLFARVAKGEPQVAIPEDALLVGSNWFRAPRGARVGLERRRSLALLLFHLAERHARERGVAVATAALFAAAWPGEKAIASAAAHRVRVAIATLRKMGLRDVVVTTPDGYALAPELTVVFG